MGEDTTVGYGYPKVSRVELSSNRGRDGWLGIVRKSPWVGEGWLLELERVWDVYGWLPSRVPSR